MVDCGSSGQSHFLMFIIDVDLSKGASRSRSLSTVRIVLVKGRATGLLARNGQTRALTSLDSIRLMLWLAMM